MGIKGLTELVKPFIKHLPFSWLEGKTIAIDTSIFIHKYHKVNVDPNSLFRLFIFMLNKLKKIGAIPIFVFDGDSPEEKDLTERHKRKDVNRDKLSFLESSPSDPVAISAYLNLSKAETDLLLVSTPEQIKDYVDKKMISYKKSLKDVTPEIIAGIQKILLTFKVKWVKAIEEADELNSFLCLSGKVDAVLSADSDHLAYGTQILILDFKMNQETIPVIYLETVLKELKVNQNQFLDMCLLMGTDYSPKIRGVTKDIPLLITTYGSLQAISQKEEYKDKVDLEKMEKARKRFMMPNYPSVSIPDFLLYQQPNINEIVGLLEGLELESNIASTISIWKRR
jgi:flap endonuclease-1